MVVCKYFLQGNCRFGGQNNNGGGGGGFGSQNRFGALSNTTGNRFGGNDSGSTQWTLNLTDIRNELTQGQGRPQWILSTYGAGRGTPASLFEGNEYSPEELRVRFYEMASKGQESQADQEAIQLWTKAEQDINNVAAHVDDVQKFMEEAEKKHPNRYDFLKADGTKAREELAKDAESSNPAPSTFGSGNPFGQATNANNTNNPFAKPAAATFGQPSGPSAFGTSAFGKPATNSAFGQPAFGQSGFGTSSSTFGQQSNGPFGQSNANTNNSTNTSSAFGQPSAASTFGKPAFGASGFGQPAFGQTTQSTTPSAFGQPAQATTASPFGQSATAPAFGASGFGQSSGAATKANPFAAPSASTGFGASSSAFGQPAQASTFGQSTQNASPFGQPSQPGAVFGQSAFGQTSQPSAFGKSTFGQPDKPTSSSPFGQAASTGTGFGLGGFGQAAQASASPFAPKATEASTTEVSMDADGPAPAQPTQQSTTMATLNPFGTPQTSTQNVQQAPSTAPSAPMTGSSEANRPQMAQTTVPGSAKLHYTETLPSMPPQLNMNKRLVSFRGQRVRYLGEPPSEVPCYNRPDGKGPERIWFAEQQMTPEVVALSNEGKLVDLQVDDAKYTDQVKQEYRYLFETGKFKDGKLPLVPPMRELCLYDF